MKKLLFCLGLFLFVASNLSLNAQNIIDAEDDQIGDHFYEKSLAKGKSAMPYPHLRESDVVWETCIWRTVDFREKFNQFFYFPNEDQKDEGQQGRTNLVNTIIKALRNGEIEVFQDDELKIPQDAEKVFADLEKEIVTPIIDYDDMGDEVGSHEETTRKEFHSSDVFKMKLKEYWYIDKQDTRQKVRIVGMSFIYDELVTKGEDQFVDSRELFWIPMNDMRVRNVLAKMNAYDEHNNSFERSYDEIFISRYFDSYVTRESNRFNRTVASYLTGQDALYESQMIEDKIFDIESDMWEY